MRKFEVKPPNFRCKLIDHHDKEITWIGFAEAEKDLDALLQRGFKQLISKKKFDLARWQKRAQRETDNVIKWRGENETKKTGEYGWRDTVWKYLKAYLFSVTNGNCAFCETDALTVSPGDVEHYRPKAAVEGDETHKGYYWLAYSVENYLPSCGNCNSSGKMNKFPVSGTRAYGPDDDLKGEKPDLLNPFDADDDPPSKHLEFVVGNVENPLGTVGGTTHRGKQTIEILKLNRQPLVDRRSRETLQFLQKLDEEYLNQLQSEHLGVKQDRVRDFITRLRKEGTEYYAAKIAAVPVWLKYWDERREAERKTINDAIDPEVP
jgi:uncharacterized protein (TIGR02646 family)